MATNFQQFAVGKHDQDEKKSAAFEVVKKRFLQVNLGTPGSTGEILNQVWIRTGSMVAYKGDVNFEYEGAKKGRGILQQLKTLSEGATLTIASSTGVAQLHLADTSKRVKLLFLQGESLTVNRNDLLAFESSITHKTTMMKKVSFAGPSIGLYHVSLQGRGFVAIATHGELLTLPVAPGDEPVFTDPKATVAWSGELNPDLKADLGKDRLSRSSGEAFQLKFHGASAQGFVLVQPYEELAEPWVRAR